MRRSRTDEPTSSALRSGLFWAVVAGRVATGAAYAATPLVTAFTVLDLGGSARDVGFVLAAGSITNLVLLVVGGVIADRFRRRRVALVSVLGAGLTQAALAAAVASGRADVVLVMSAEVVVGALAALFMPALSSLVADTVAKEHLTRATIIVRVALTLGLTAGTSLAGVVIAVADTAAGLTWVAVLFLAGAASLGLPVRDRSVGGNDTPGVEDAADEQPSPPTGLTQSVRQLGEGFRQLRNQPGMWPVLLHFVVVNACISGGWTTVGPLIAQDRLGRAAWGAVLAAVTIGMLLGGLVALRLPRPHDVRRGALVSAGTALGLLVLGLAPHLALLVLAALIAGAAMEVFEVSWQLTIQRVIPPEALGRVFACELTVSLAAIPLGQAVAGLAAAAGSAQLTSTVAGLLVIGSSLVTGSRLSLRRSRPEAVRSANLW